MHNANFTGSVIRNCDMGSVDFSNVNFAGATLQNVKISPENLESFKEATANAELVENIEVNISRCSCQAMVTKILTRTSAPGEEPVWEETVQSCSGEGCY